MSGPSPKKNSWRRRKGQPRPQRRVNRHASQPNRTHLNGLLDPPPSSALKRRTTRLPHRRSRCRSQTRHQTLHGNPYQHLRLPPTRPPNDRCPSRNSQRLSAPQPHRTRDRSRRCSSRRSLAPHAPRSSASFQRTGRAWRCNPRCPIEASILRVRRTVRRRRRTRRHSKCEQRHAEATGIARPLTAAIVSASEPHHGCRKPLIPRDLTWISICATGARW